VQWTASVLFFCDKSRKSVKQQRRNSPMERNLLLVRGYTADRTADIGLK